MNDELNYLGSYDYYLLAIMNAATNPKPYIIQNPAEKLKPDEKVEVVRYIIDV